MSKTNVVKHKRCENQALHRLNNKYIDMFHAFSKFSIELKTHPKRYANADQQNIVVDPDHIK